jgi:Gram-negative bacterial TonB protein C-terminal
MRYSVRVCAVLIFCSVLFLCTQASPQKRAANLAVPVQFAIGRHTFIDVGPPNDFYELFLVRSASDDISVQRFTLIPPGDKCIAPAKFESASGSIRGTPAELLGSTNPCTIPEKDLHRELKRCKNCLVFSGANVVMQVQCGTQTRLIRSDILDRDMFDPTIKTPEHTSWTIALLRRLDLAVGPGAIDTQRIFSTPEADDQHVSIPRSETLQDLSAGKYDVLFQNAPDKPSDLFRASQIPAPLPKISLVSSVPFPPETFVQPVYPPLARMAHIEGMLSFKFTVDPEGGATNLMFESGHPLLRGVVTEAVNHWKFPTASIGNEIKATIEFALNCPKSR